METLALYVGVAFVGGLLARFLRLPPLVGFLAAGFYLGFVDAPELTGLHEIAEIGVALLLFTIGLKLDVRTLLRREVWLTTVTHMVVMVGVGIGFLGALAILGAALVGGDSLGTLALVGFALSFSSTVFVIKVLEERSDATSLYGRVAIGILIMQDVAAVTFFALAKAEPPSPWALLLLLLIPARPVLHWLLDRVGHGELQTLFGLAIALGPGFYLFDALGVDGEFGALVMGVLLATHPAASDVTRTLTSFKDLMLIGFFLEIGLHGTPTLQHVGMALGLLVLLPVKAALFAVLLWTMRLRRRTSFLSALALGNFSEFGIIVAAFGVANGMLSEDWLVVIALAVALSFVLSAVVNGRGVQVATRLSRLLPAKDSTRLHAEDRLVDIGDADVVVLGLGRVGSSAYARLRDEYGLRVVGVEHNAIRVDALTKYGFDVVQADATDLEFWARVKRAGHVRMAVLAMPFHNANLGALDRLQEAGFDGYVAAVARYDDDAAELREHGADAVYHLYGAAGAELADRANEVLSRGT